MPAKFIVKLKRTVVQRHDYQVTAETIEEAETKAMRALVNPAARSWYWRPHAFKDEGTIISCMERPGSRGD